MTNYDKNSDLRVFRFYVFWAVFRQIWSAGMVNALRKTNQRTVTTVSRTTRRERPKSAPYLRLKNNIQGTTFGVFSKKVAQGRKTQKEAIQAQ